MSDPASMPIPFKKGSGERGEGGAGAEVAAAKSRAALYGFLSRAFSYPDEAWFAAMRGAVGETIRSLKDPLLPAFQMEIIRLAGECQESLSSGAADEAMRAYLILFGHSSGGSCPPYEIEYGPKSEVVGPNRLADVASFYAAFGVEVAPDSGERLDHLSVEFEFLHYLCLREAHALVQGHPLERVELLRDAQKKFLQEHLGRFAPVFAKKVVKLAEDTLYGKLAALADRWVLADCERLGVDPRVGVLPMKEWKPPTDEDVCVSCELATSCSGTGPAKPEGAQAAGAGQDG